MDIVSEEDNLYSLHFIDDQLILTKDESNVHYMLRKIDEQCNN